MIKYGQIEKTDVDLIEEVYLHLSKCTDLYPNLFGWYYQKVIPTLNKTRHIIIAIDSNTNAMVGFIIVKNDKERKICSLYVLEKYRGQKIGKTLLEKGMQVIKMQKPLVTVSNRVLDYYLPLFVKSGFTLRYIYRDYYVKGDAEYVFNGNLPDKKTAITTKL